MPSPPPELAAFAAELAAELAGQGAHDDLLVADAVAAAVRLKLLHADPRMFLPHTVDRSWDRDHDLASRAYFRAHRALLASRSTPSNRSPARRPSSTAPRPWIPAPSTPGPNPPESNPRTPVSAGPTDRPAAASPPESRIPNPPPSPPACPPPAAPSPPESGISNRPSPPLSPPPAASSPNPPLESFDAFLRPAPRHPRRPIRTHPRDPSRSRPQPTPADRISFRRRPDDILPLSATPRASPAG